MFFFTCEIKNILFHTIVLTLVLLLTACETTKKSVYFSDISNDPTSTLHLATKFIEPSIQPDDILTVTIQTPDPKLTSIVNQNLALSGTDIIIPGTSQAQNIGYLVDKEGIIQLPVIGNVKVSGITTYQARDLILNISRKFFRDATIQVRFANFRVNVMGEVMRPATYSFPNEKISILDALSLAGDLTIYAKRENVLLIRDNKGEKEFIRFNLNSSDIFKSSYFYLRQNDIIYVEPSNAKLASTNAARTQTITLIGSFLSVLIVLLTQLHN